MTRYVVSIDRVALLIVTAAALIAAGWSGAQAQAQSGVRGYEMVSPADKNGAEIDRDIATGQQVTWGAAGSGDAVAYPALGQFPESVSGAVKGQYLSVRGSSGWSTRGISPPIAPYPRSEATFPLMWRLSDDLSHAIVGTNASLTPQSSLLGGSWGLYAQNISGPGASSYELLSRPSAQLAPDVGGSEPFRFLFSGASSDMRHVVMDATTRKLTPEAPESGESVYVWSNGQVRLVSVLPSGEPSTRAVGGWAAINQGQEYPGDHLVSDDGRRIFFSGVDEHALYVRENGTSTRLVSGSERAGDDPAAPQYGTFLAAEADSGSKALFTSISRLTDDATACDALCPGGQAEDLYLWNAGAPAGDRLTDLTTGDPNGAGVLGLAAATDDLSRIYFVATGALAPDAAPGTPNLYTWSEEDGLQHVAVLDFQDGSVWSFRRESPTERYRDARASGDGDQFLFVSRAPLAGVSPGGLRQVYLYDASSGELTCVSCDEGAATGDAWLSYTEGEDTRAPYRLPRNLSVDGDRVFFETAATLVDADTNGKTDVYEWSDGKLSLISTGKGTEGSKFIDASESGDDVFFTTREQLVGADNDELVDVYDARVGGGRPEIPPREPCTGSDCQPPPLPRPSLPEPGSDTPSGDPPIAKRAAFKVKRLTAAGRRALAQGRRASLVIQVNKAGRVSVRGVARAGKKTRTVLRASKRARGKGTVRLRVRVSSTGRRQLAGAGRLRVALNVRFSGVREPKVLRLNLRAGSGHGNR